MTERPNPGAPRPWTFPAFERRSVAGGRMLTAHLPGKALAVTSLVLDAGAVLEPSAQAGVSEIVARALAEGSAGRDSYEFGVAGERIGATWRSSTDWDSLRVGFEVPAGDLAAATALLADAARSAEFADDVLERVLDERIDEISIERSQPAVLAGEALGSALFQPESRYARPDGGDPESIGSLQHTDIRAYRDARIRREAATLVVVGDLDGIDLDGLGHTVFDGWDGAGSGTPAPTVASRGPGRRVVVVGSPQGRDLRRDRCRRSTARRSSQFPSSPRGPTMCVRALGAPTTRRPGETS